MATVIFALFFVYFLWRLYSLRREPMSYWESVAYVAVTAFQVLWHNLLKL